MTTGPRPLIAVTTWKRVLPSYWDPQTPQFSLDADYVAALRRAGAVPLLLAQPDPDDVVRILDLVEGLLVSGGPDIDPASYGAVNEGQSIETDAVADRCEVALLQAARDRRLPTLGVCRGLQALNVALGGTMQQHVWTDDGPHRRNPDHPAELKRHGHDLRLDPDSRLAGLLGGRTQRRVNSFHHQGVDRLADGLSPVAWAPDGLVEAAEAGDGWDCLAVQWHPEKTADGTDDVLFAALTEAAARAGSALGSRR
ncbi:MAG: gamma-glutamyl-gamma-aminobutyrate hydrolase family protein [Egibacteraceae bacterium]